MHVRVAVHVRVVASDLHSRFHASLAARLSPVEKVTARVLARFLINEVYPEYLHVPC